MAGKINFTEMEKEMLMELVAANVEIIEDKKNDGVVVQRKEKAWWSIMEKFNFQNGVRSRTCKQLKALWKNMKSKAKKELWKSEDENEIEKISSQLHYQKGAIIIPQPISCVHNRYDNEAETHEHAPYPTTCPNKQEFVKDTVAVCHSDETVVDISSRSGDQLSPSYTASSARSPGYARKRRLDNENDDTNENILKFARQEHEQKMKNLKLKEEILQLKKQFLLQKLSNNPIPD